MYKRILKIFWIDWRIWRSWPRKVNKTASSDTRINLKCVYDAGKQRFIYQSLGIIRETHILFTQEATALASRQSPSIISTLERMDSGILLTLRTKQNTMNWSIGSSTACSRMCFPVIPVMPIKRRICFDIFQKVRCNENLLCFCLVSLCVYSIIYSILYSTRRVLWYCTCVQ